jgi:hypothetical protein
MCVWGCVEGVMTRIFPDGKKKDVRSNKNVTFGD